MTGMDRSHAQFARRDPTFADPVVNRVRPQTEFLSVARIDFDSFSHGKRGQFRSVLDTYIDQIEDGVDTLKETANARQERPSTMFGERVAQLENQEAAVEARIKALPRIDASAWPSYKSDLRSQIVDLERSYIRLQTAMR